MAITDASGRELYRQGVPLDSQTQDEKHVFGKFIVPGQNLEIYIVSPASGQVDDDIAAGQMRVEVYQIDSTTPLAAQVINQGQATKIGDLTYTFVRERQFTGLMVSRDPGAIWVWIGLGLLLVGICATMFLRHHRIWVRVTEDADGGSLVRAGSPDRYDYTFDHRFHDFFGSLGEPVAEQAEERGARDA